MQVFMSDIVFLVLMMEIYVMLGVDFKEIIILEFYLQEYYGQILKKLKDLKVLFK